MSETTVVPLADVLDFREGPGIMAVDFRDAGVPLIRLAGLKAGSRLLDGCNFLDPEKATSKWAHFRVAEGDVLLSTSASLGEVAVVGSDGVGAIPYTGIIRFRPKDGRVAAEFIQYALRSAEFKQQIVEMGVGSVMNHFGPSHLKHMTLRLPSVGQQRAIAEVLGALDDKIAANAKLAEITDHLVRAEYIALSEDVPETRTIASIATHPRDLVDPSQSDDNQIYVGLEHVPRRLMWLSESGLSSDVTSTKASFAKGDVLFGKLRPYFHKVVSAPADGISSTDILVLRAKHPSLTGFLLAAAASDATVERCTAASEGTRMPRTSWKDLAAIEVPWPGDTAAQAFSATVAALRDRVESAMVENRMLAEMRDALLPELMSDKIRVRDPERVIEGVV